MSQGSIPLAGPPLASLVNGVRETEISELQKNHDAMVVLIAQQKQDLDALRAELATRRPHHADMRTQTLLFSRRLTERTHSERQRTAVVAHALRSVVGAIDNPLGPANPIEWQAETERVLVHARELLQVLDARGDVLTPLPRPTRWDETVAALAGLYHWAMDAWKATLAGDDLPAAPPRLEDARALLARIAAEPAPVAMPTPRVEYALVVEQMRALVAASARPGPGEDVGPALQRFYGEVKRATNLLREIDRP